jgi:RNA-directed DNA polymerase
LILKTDVKNFFGSITEHYIVNVFRALGYSKKVSIFFGKICCLNGSLPQGAATSGYLSNIYLTKLDAVIFEFCKNEKVRYTRYADDMTFSGQSFDTDMYLKLVAKELAKLKLNLNHQKSRILKPHNRQIVTGLVVNKNVSVPRDYLRGLRQDCYYITKFGIYGHCRKVALKDPRVLLETVIGRLAYAVQYQVKDPKWGILHSEMMDVRRETFGY